MGSCVVVFISTCLLHCAFSEDHLAEKANRLTDAKFDAITEELVHAAQKMWADSLAEIGSLYKSGAHRRKAEQMVDDLYAFSLGKVLFKPLKAGDRPNKPNEHHAFRFTRDAAVSYFVGGDNKFPEDRGFAVEVPWKTVRWENEGFLLRGDTAMVMGHCYLVDANGAETKAEFSFGYIRDPNDSNKLRITLHHTSFPYTYTQTSIFYYVWRFAALVFVGFMVCSMLMATRVKTSSTTSFLARWIIAVRQIQRSVKQLFGIKSKGLLPMGGGDRIGKGV